LFERSRIVRRGLARSAISRESFVDAPLLVGDAPEIAQRRDVGRAELQRGFEPALACLEVAGGRECEAELDVKLRALGARGGRFLAVCPSWGTSVASPSAALSA